MFIKRFLKPIIIISICFICAFISLFNGIVSIKEITEKIKRERNYGYEYEATVLINSNGSIGREEIKDIGKRISKGNAFVEEMVCYFDKSEDVYRANVVLAENEDLPIPLKKGRRRIKNGEIIAPNNQVLEEENIETHGKKWIIKDLIKIEEYSEMGSTFIITADDYFDVFDNDKFYWNISICSNEKDVYPAYEEIRDAVLEIDPFCYIAAYPKEKKENLFEYQANGDILLSITLYVFAVINVIIISYYWIEIRKKEIAIRKTYGAENKQIIRMLARENLIIIGICAIMALVTQTIITLICGEMEKLYKYSFILISYIIFALLTTFFAMIIPSFKTMKIQPAEGVKR